MGSLPWSKPSPVLPRDKQFDLVSRSGYAPDGRFSWMTIPQIQAPLPFPAFLADRRRFPHD